MVATAFFNELTLTILIWIDTVLTWRTLRKFKLHVYIAEFVVETEHYDDDKIFSNVPKAIIAHIHITRCIDATFFASYAINMPPCSQHRTLRPAEFKVLHART